MACAAFAACAVCLPTTASAQTSPVGQATSTFKYTKNLHPVGYSARTVPLDNTVPGQGVFNSDLAFQGNTVVQGTYAGFRLIDVTEPGDPQQIVNWTECASNTNTVGNQGDVIVWGNLVFRSWNSGTPAPQYSDGTPIPVEDPARFTTPGAFCGDWPMFREAADPTTGLPERGQAGVHIIDISDPAHPAVIGFVDTPCGSHTETLVPDLANNRLLIYSNSSSNTTFGSPAPGETPMQCAGIDVIKVPLNDPASASYLRFEQAGDPAEGEHHSCHDTGVVLGAANLVACAGTAGGTNTGVNVFSTDPADGGSKEDPAWLYHKITGGISLGHSAAFTWDGKVLVGAMSRAAAVARSARRTMIRYDGLSSS